MFSDIAVELGHPFEEVPQEEQPQEIVIGVDAQDLQDRPDIEVPELQRVRGPIEQGRVPVLEQCRHLGMQGSENDQTAGDVGGTEHAACSI